MATKRSIVKPLVILIALGGAGYFAWKKFGPKKDKFGNTWTLGKAYGTSTTHKEVMKNGVYSGQAGVDLRIVNGFATVTDMKGAASKWDGAWVKA